MKAISTEGAPGQTRDQTFTDYILPRKVRRLSIGNKSTINDYLKSLNIRLRGEVLRRMFTGQLDLFHFRYIRTGKPPVFSLAHARIFSLMLIKAYLLVILPM